MRGGVIESHSGGAGTTLTLLAGKHRFVLHGEATCVVGRGPEADLALDDDLVSRRHLVVFCSGGVWHVADESSNGTFRDGRHLKRARVESATVLRLGDPMSGPELRLIPGAQPPPAPRERPSDVHSDLRTRVRIGRAEDNDVVVSDLLASRTTPR